MTIREDIARASVIVFDHDLGTATREAARVRWEMEAYRLPLPSFSIPLPSVSAVVSATEGLTQFFERIKRRMAMRSARNARQRETRRKKCRNPHRGRP